MRPDLEKCTYRNLRYATSTTATARPQRPRSVGAAARRSAASATTTASRASVDQVRGDGAVLGLVVADFHGRDVAVDGLLGRAAGDRVTRLQGAVQRPFVEFADGGRAGQGRLSRVSTGVPAIPG